MNIIKELTKIFLFIFVLVVGGMLGYIFVDSFNTTDNPSDKNQNTKYIQQKLSNIKLFESDTEKQFKAIKKAFDNKNWNEFTQMVNIEIMVINSLNEAMEEERKNIKTEKDKESMKILEGLIPIAASYTKNDLFEYFNKNKNVDNFYVKLFSLTPNKIHNEKTEGGYKILPVSYIGTKTGAEITVLYKFIQENNELRLVGVRDNDKLKDAMGWGDEYNDYNEPNYKNEYKEKENLYEYPKQKRTSEKENAYKTAREYASSMNMSRRGVYEQLIFEGFSEIDSNEALERLSEINWKANALKSAISYQNEQSMSKKEIREQLIFEGFTQEEADYAFVRMK